ncbi:MAG: FAD-dependent oxidoreductase [Burkholderiales bacterium]|nr:FAD-dependent oxidoreductase [Burkholderiales bacterium]
MTTTEVPRCEPLRSNIDAEVCIIGAGIAGLTTAYLLGKQGKKVVLIDAMEIGAGETGRTTAHFFPPDNRYFKIEQAFGSAKAKQIADSYRAATDLVESIVQDEGIACSFERVDGYLFSLIEEQHLDLTHELAAARRAGLDVDMLARAPNQSFDTGPCLCFHHCAQFHPLQYLAGLARAFATNGGQIYGETRALKIEDNNQKQVVVTNGGRIRADAVVVATNTPFNDRVVMHTKQSGYRTYVVGMRVPKGSVPRVQLWDTGDPYYYVRLAPTDLFADHDVLIVGGADHKVGQEVHPEQHYAIVENWVRERYPMAENVEYAWSGEIMEPADGVAYLGRNPLDNDNVYIITGDSGNGMTHCTAGAILISDLIMGRDNPWEAIYDPARKAIHGMSEFLKEQANTISQYRDWLTPGEVDSTHEIRAGHGAILRDGIKKLAVYRDEAGELHSLSAACTHLGCVVAWNAAEKSWDCPCHASRFSATGEVLHGPAMSPLEAAELPTQEMPPPAHERPEEKRKPR